MECDAGNVLISSAAIFDIRANILHVAGYIVEQNYQDKTTMEQTILGRPHLTPRHHEKEELPIVPMVVGFPISNNEFSVLSNRKPIVP